MSPSAIIKKNGGSMKKNDIIFLSLFSSLILFFGIGILLFPMKSFSEKENRALAQTPSVSAKAVLSGEYFKELGDFYSDQFPFRDSFTSVYALSELSLGKSQINGVVVSDGILAARSKDAESTSNALENIESLCQKKPKVYIPPSSIQVFSQSLPQSLKKEIGATAHNFPENTYYKTDHHWTADGAYIAYTEICKILGVDAYSESFFKKEIAATDFRGTAFARSCLPESMVTPDTVTLYRYEGDTDVKIYCHDSGALRYGFYDLHALADADKYRVFLGGNYARLSVTGEGEKPRLVLIKDSFANSVIPFLALHFDIEVIDPRYSTKGELAEFLSEENILFLMSEATLNECFN